MFDKKPPHHGSVYKIFLFQISLKIIVWILPDFGNWQWGNFGKSNLNGRRIMNDKLTMV